MAKKRRLANKLETAIKQAIKSDGRSLYALAKATGVDLSQLTRFTEGADMRLKSAAKLCEALGLALVKTSKGEDTTAGDTIDNDS